MTPCEKLGYKVGDRFEVVKGLEFDKGSIIELWCDDGTYAPLFLLISGHTNYSCCNGKKGAYKNINEIRPLKPEWDGTGLPPVGAVVEYIKFDTCENEGICCDQWKNGDRLEVIAHKEVWGKVLAVMFNNRHQTVSALIPKHYRPLSTDRDKAIDELRAFLITEGWSGADSKDAAELYDKGLRLAHQIKPQHKEG